MRVSELLLEEFKVSHVKVMALVYSLALKAIKAPPDIIAHARELAQQTDDFFTSDIDEVTRSLEQYAKGRCLKEDVVDSLEAAVEAVGMKIEDYFKNPWNHPPGYKPPSIKFTLPSTTVLTAGLYKLPGFEEAVKQETAKARLVQRNAHKELASKMDEAKIASMAKMIDTNWHKAFAPKLLEKICKNPEKYDFPKGSCPRSEKDLIELFRKEANNKPDKLVQILATWVLEGFEHPADFYSAAKVKSIMLKVAQKSKHLSSFMKKD
jgi:hypothetical protein